MEPKLTLEASSVVSMAEAAAWTCIPHLLDLLHHPPLLCCSQVTALRLDSEKGAQLPTSEVDGEFVTVLLAVVIPTSVKLVPLCGPFVAARRTLWSAQAMVGAGLTYDEESAGAAIIFYQTSSISFLHQANQKHRHPHAVSHTFYVALNWRNNWGHATSKSWAHSSLLNSVPSWEHFPQMRTRTLKTRPCPT